MTTGEFTLGFDRLQHAFGLAVKDATAGAYYERFGDFSGNDWRAAVTRAIDAEQHFPRITAMLKHLSETAEACRRREWGAAKHREREATERTTARCQAGWLRDTLDALCLPTLEERKAALTAIEAASTRAVPLGGCDCIDGLVFWTEEAGYSCVAACSACVAGTTQPKSFPRADPVTLEAIR